MSSTNDDFPRSLGELAKEVFGSSEVQTVSSDDVPAESGPLPTNESELEPITVRDLIDVLGLTIKRDKTNKLIVFLAQLSAYTEDSQINISFNAPSSTGKSYIPIEVAALFPPEDVIMVGYCSPTAFFHDYGVFDKEKGGYIVDLSRKIVIFLDQPHTLLLQHLRPMLSHDKKEIRLKITDKTQQYGLRTKNIRLIGYPAVTFCTAALDPDEQEATRFLLLSPEISEEKIREGVFEKISRESDRSVYFKELESNPKRQLLIRRILAVKKAKVGEIKIGSPELIQKLFFQRTKALKPRHQRDIGRIISLAKVFALLNFPFREREDQVLVASGKDIKAAFKVWDEIADAQGLGLPPYVHNLYKDIILTAYEEKNSELTGGVKLGLARPDILQKHYKVYGRHLPDWLLRQQIIPMLETSGVITQEADPSDRRRMLVYPTTPLTISQAGKYSESDGGVGKDQASESTKSSVTDAEQQLKKLGIDPDKPTGELTNDEILRIFPGATIEEPG